ncbi:hypothetical protein DRE_03822 [Drechslerella stenobrocha 248]|uniref:SGNH hydrolase-type esterase domain-containing protein n=1 Tax=Drechslerella stenobrocha 248 TaxID=1043628 RepID=W7IDH1_9PEZI|nr:hypothetical protein DRE_03822 [Drechslerella stenobrocha 248]
MYRHMEPRLWILLRGRPYRYLQPEDTGARTRLLVRHDPIGPTLASEELIDWQLPRRGYNSSHARAIVDDVIPPADGALDLKLLIVFFGANDAVLPGYEQHVDIAEYKENIKAIVQHPHVKQHGAKVVIITPPPVYEHKRLPPGTRRNAVTKQYAEAAIDVAKETGAEVLKLWHVFMDHAGWKEGGPLIGDINAPTSEELGELFTDGLHLTAKGYQLYFDSLMALLKERLPEIHDFERQYPNWGEAPRYRSE